MKRHQAMRYSTDNCSTLRCYRVSPMLGRAIFPDAENKGSTENKTLFWWIFIDVLVEGE